MGLPLLKAIVAVIVLGAGLGGALLPWFMRRKLPADRVITLANTFAGGVLGGAGLIHLLQGGIEGFRRYAPQLHYPLALLLAGIGFLLILLIEAVIVGERSMISDVRSHHVHAISHEVGYGPLSMRPPGAYAYILLLVLSVHSLIVGMALGSQDSLYGIFVVFLAILAHKTVAGFALGIGYTRTGIPWSRAIWGVIFFSGMTPLGILFGAVTVGLLTSPRSAHLFTAAFNSIGAGTFLYIATLDIVRIEFSQPGDHLAKWLSTCVGFAIMAILAMWI